MSRKNSLFLVSGVGMILMFSMLISLNLNFATAYSIKSSQIPKQQSESDNSTIPEVDIDSEPKSIGNNTQQKTKRNLNVQATDNYISLLSMLKEGDNKDQIKIDVNSNNELSIKCLYKVHSNDSKFNLEFQVQFYEIIEYSDINDDGIYSAINDSKLISYPLNDFLPISYSEQGDTQKTFIFNITSSDGVFQTIIYAVEGYTDVNNTLVAPSEIKIDFIIRNFPYTSNNSRLGLAVRFQSSAQYRIKNSTKMVDEGLAENEAQVEMESNNSKSYFSWVTKALADGVPIDVISSPINAENNQGKNPIQRFYLNYPHAVEIIHDPKIGIDLGETGFTIPGYPIVGLFLLGLVGIAGILCKRKLK